MVFQSFCEANMVKICWQFRVQIKDAKSPNLATFSNHENAKRFDFQSNIQSSIQWIFVQDFDLIPFLYIYATNPDGIHVKRAAERP